MKHFIRSFLLFILALGISYPILLFFRVVLTPKMFHAKFIGVMHSRLAEIDNYHDIDILFLGSSHAYRSFDTRIFNDNGLKSFNLGSSAQTPIQTNLLLKRYLNKLNPRIVVYEVYPDTFSGDGVESAIDIINNSKNDLYSIGMALGINHLRLYNELIISLLQDIFSRNSSSVEQNAKTVDTYISGGFVERELSFFKHTEYPKEEWQLNDQMIRAFEKNVALIKRRNIQLILVFAPISEALYDSYTNNYLIEELMTKHANFFNFNKKIELDDSLHFYDSHHLNQLGVQIFDKDLIKTIIDRKQAKKP
jgi:hypothetical protein